MLRYTNRHCQFLRSLMESKITKRIGKSNAILLVWTLWKSSSTWIVSPDFSPHCDFIEKYFCCCWSYQTSPTCHKPLFSQCSLASHCTAYISKQSRSNTTVQSIVWSQDPSQVFLGKTLNSIYQYLTVETKVPYFILFIKYTFIRRLTQRLSAQNKVWIQPTVRKWDLKINRILSNCVLQNNVSKEIVATPWL